MKIERPTTKWREQVAEEQAQIASGELDRDDDFFSRIHPEAFLAAVDQRMAEYEARVSACARDASGYADVMRAIETFVNAMNDLNAEYDGDAIETDEREDLCAYVDELIKVAGISPEELAASQGCERNELTDQWRDW